MSRAAHPIEDLDRPRTIADLARWLSDHGEPISKAQLYRYAKTGVLPVVEIGERGKRTTARAYFAALTPKTGARDR